MGRLMAINCATVLIVFCYLLVQVESEELASTELSAALTENAKLRDEIEGLTLACSASNAVTPSHAAASTENAETGGVNGARQRINLELGEEEAADPSEFRHNAKVDVKTQIFQAGYQAGQQAAKSETDAKLSKAKKRSQRLKKRLKKSKKKARRAAKAAASRAKKSKKARRAAKAASTAVITSAAVKCSGNTQNQKQLKGTMDCESRPKGNEPKHKGSACLDNLSSGKYYKLNANGLGRCATFNDNWVSVTMQDMTSNQARSGIVNKAFVTHPNKAATTVGVLGFKRVLCNKQGGQGEQCTTFKNAVCIKCPVQIFASKDEGDATMKEKAVFIECCVRGGKQLKATGGKYFVPGEPGKKKGKAEKKGKAGKKKGKAGKKKGKAGKKKGKAG